MKEDSSAKKILLIFGSVTVTTVLIFVGVFFLILSPSTNGDLKGIAVQQGGTQIVEITAKTGYSPKTSTATANKPLTLRIDTKGTYDCSSGIRIPKLNITKQLPANGTTDIEIPAQTAGTKLDFTCSMGMYSGTIIFS